MNHINIFTYFILWIIDLKPEQREEQDWKSAKIDFEKCLKPVLFGGRKIE